MLTYYIQIGSGPMETINAISLIDAVGRYCRLHPETTDEDTIRYRVLDKRMGVLCVN